MAVSKKMSHKKTLIALAATTLAVLAHGAAGAAAPQLIASVQDGKAMVVNGVTLTVPGEDTLAIIEVGAGAPKVLQEIPVPATSFGPPQSVDISPDRTLALVASGTKRDPANPKATALDDLVSVVDLTARPPKVIDTLHAGLGVEIGRAHV